MNAIRVIDHLKDMSSWTNASVAARRTFCGVMEACDYGREQTRDAWNWYLTGWVDGRIEGIVENRK